MIVVAPSIEQGQLHAERLGIARPAILTTNGRASLPTGSYPLPEDVVYAPGWERGCRAHRVVDDLRRAYVKRLA